MKATENVSLKLKDPLGSIIERQKQQGDTFWALCWFFFFFKFKFESFKRYLKQRLGFPGDSSGEKPTCPCRRPKRLGFNPWVGKIPWRRTSQPTPVLLPGESPWTEKPGGLQSMGLQRAGHGWGTHAQTEITKWLWLMIQDHPIFELDGLSFSGHWIASLSLQIMDQSLGTWRVPSITQLAVEVLRLESRTSDNYFGF